jgi:hypothetical protein
MDDVGWRIPVMSSGRRQGACAGGVVWRRRCSLGPGIQSADERAVGAAQVDRHAHQQQLGAVAGNAAVADPAIIQLPLGTRPRRNRLFLGHLIESAPLVPSTRTIEFSRLRRRLFLPLPAALQLTKPKSATLPTTSVCSYLAWACWPLPASPSANQRSLIFSHCSVDH